MENKKKQGLVLSILGVLSTVLITGGVTYAFFNYVGEGTTDNVITTGSLTFLYTENSSAGNGIKIENSFPKSDDLGKVSTKVNEYFDFKVTSSTTGTNAVIPYEVTARKSSDSDNIDEHIRVYLTKGEEEVLLENYSELDQTSKVEETKYTEKTIYTGEVPANTSNYEENFRLRMWLDNDTRFENEVMNNKTFKLTVNVYANAEIVTVPEGPITMTADTALTIGTAVTGVDGSKWHVLEESVAGNEYVTLLSDYNLNSDGTYNTECQGVTGNSSSYRCSTIAFDSDKTNIYDETDSNNIGYFIKNTYVPLVTAALPGTTNVTLPTADQVALADGKTFSQSNLGLTNSWLLTTNYWTQTSNSSGASSVLYVDGGNARLSSGLANDSYHYGARASITTLKSNLLAE